MTRTQQSSIRSFFQPRSRPVFAAPPSSAPPSTAAADSPNGPNDATRIAASAPSPPSPPPPPPPPAPPLPRTADDGPARPPQPGAPKPVTIPITLPPGGVPVLPSPPSLPAGATIVPLAEQHVPALRRINSLLLPVAYPDSFYARALDPLASGLFSRAILWQDSDAAAPKVVGGLICRLEPNTFVDAQGRPLDRPPPAAAHQPRTADVPLNTPYHSIYIQSLALLSPYRGLGLAAAALEHIVASAVLLPAAGSSIDARTIYAHVWTENDEGLRWYEARGFARDGPEPVKGYYFKLRPDTAWVVRRHIGPGSAQESPALPPPPPSGTASSFPSAGPGESKGGVLAAAVNLPPITATTPPPPPLPPSSSSSGNSRPSSSAPPRNQPQPQSQLPPPPSANPNPNPKPRQTPTANSPAPASSVSFQNMRPETEWNDLPPDMVTGPHDRAGGGGSSRGAGSGAGARKRKERAYPSAAFGN